jgi:hypothetical protein
MNSDKITLIGSPMPNKKKGGRKTEEETKNKDNIPLKFK